MESTAEVSVASPITSNGELNEAIKDALEKKLNAFNTDIIFPSSDGYEDLIKRWSDTSEKRAVRHTNTQPRASKTVSSDSVYTGSDHSSQRRGGDFRSDKRLTG